MLEATGIHKSYSSGKKELAVLKGVNLSIAEGRFISIVGPSGAGKSTLLHILGGLDSPTKGKVIFEGEDVYSLTDKAASKVRNQRIGFVFQFYHLLSEFTVLENVLMPGLIGPHREGGLRQLKENALGLLNQVGLSERAAHFPAELSGGEKQRAAIARSLINSPRLLLCDEPTGNLDSGSGEGVIALIKEISRSNGMTVVLVTHNPELVKAADSVYHLKDGILVN